MNPDRGYFLSSLAGLVMGAMLVTALPVMGSSGDAVVAGRFNDSGGFVTRLKGKGNPTLRLINWNNRPGLEVRVAGNTPPLAVSSSGLVDNLNADMVDGMEAAAFSPSIGVDERLDVGQSAVLATVAGASVTFYCNDDGGGGSQAVVTVAATADGLHLVFRDPISYSALQMQSWAAANPLDTTDSVDVVVWDPDQPKQFYVDNFWGLPLGTFTAWSPSGGILEGKLIGHLPTAGPEDCILTGYLVATG